MHGHISQRACSRASRPLQIRAIESRQILVPALVLQVDQALAVQSPFEPADAPGRGSLVTAFESLEYSRGLTQMFSTPSSGASQAMLDRSGGEILGIIKAGVARSSSKWVFCS